MNYDDCYDDLYTVCIFPFLNFKDLYSISLTCKYFSTLYKYSKHKNQDVIDYFKIIFLRFIYYICPCIISLTININ